MEQKTRKKRKLGSYPFISVTFSVMLALLVIGIFGVLVLHAQKLTTLIQENIELQVYLNKQITRSEINRINRTIGSKDFVLKKDNNSRIRLITKEEAADKFVRDTGENFKEFLGENPLRDLLVVNIDPAYQPADSLKKIKAEIEQMQGVYEVSYVESLVESINDNLTKIGIVLIGFFVILLIVVIILINNTIKLALFSQRFLIRSMQLVGATSGFIKTPFLRRSAWYGFLAGIFASGALLVILFYSYNRIEDLRTLKDNNNLLMLFAALVITGVIVCYFSTWRAIRKYLKMSLDELY